MKLPGFQYWHDEEGEPHVRFSPWLVWAVVLGVLIRGLT